MTEIYFEKLDLLIIEQLKNAECDVKIAVAWITDLNIINHIEKLLDNGISVSIIFFNDKINKIELFEKLYNKGAQIKYTTSLMHNKFCIIDNEIILNGSYNWTNSAKNNNENIQITKSTKIAAQFTEEFHKLLKKSSNANLYFDKKKKKFDDFFSDILLPTSYPNFYKIDINNYNIKNWICTVLNDVYVTKNLTHIYKLFENEEKFIKFFKIVYEWKSEGKYGSVAIKTYVDTGQENGGRYGAVNSFLAIDILQEKDIQNTSIFTASDYVNQQLKFATDDIIYFKNNTAIKYLIIGIWGREHLSNLHEKLLMITLTKETELYKLNTHEFKRFEKEEDYLIISEYEENLGPICIERKYFININSFALDRKKTDSDYASRKKDLLSGFYSRVREREQLEKKKRIESYKRQNECYIATMIYKNENHLNIIKLRDYRDTFLLQNYLGYRFIILYYKISPWLVKKISQFEIITSILKFILEKVVLKLINHSK